MATLDSISAHMRGKRDKRWGKTKKLRRSRQISRQRGFFVLMAREMAPSRSHVQRPDEGFLKSATRLWPDCSVRV